MAYVRGFGCYLPGRIVDNAEIARATGADETWLLSATGIEERRYAAADESVADLGVLAARDCLASANLNASEVGLILVACGSSERRFPGPAAAIGTALGIGGIPAVDLPLASAGSLFGIALAAELSIRYGHVLVIATEIMSRVIRMDSAGRDTAILFGDGAGACLISAGQGFLKIHDSLLQSDGEFARALHLELNSPLEMDGRTVILQAARKLPRAIAEILARNPSAQDIGAFILHQANLNLIKRVAQALDVPEAKFFCNLNRYGNTSSASLLIAATEWWRERGGQIDAPIVLAAFGAGLNWGAVLAIPA